MEYFQASFAENAIIFIPFSLMINLTDKPDKNYYCFAIIFSHPYYAFNRRVHYPVNYFYILFTFKINFTPFQKLIIIIMSVELNF